MPFMEAANGYDATKPILIAGAGIVGLTLAQGCKRQGIPFRIFERDEHRAARSQGWAVTLHWCLNALRRTIGPELSEQLFDATVDPTLKLDAGNFLFLNAETGAVRYKIPPTKERYRLNRLKLLNLLSTDLDIQWGKGVASYSDLPDGSVEVKFLDGTTATGSMLVGCDGNNSRVRRAMYSDSKKSSLTPLPVNVTGVVRHFTPEQGAEPRALDPLLFMGLHPKTSNYLWYSIQEMFPEPNGKHSFDAVIIMSWEVKDEVKDAIPSTKREQVANMKSRAAGFFPLFKDMVDGIPDDTERVTSLTLADFATLDWETKTNVTLAGDSGHAMTMYRGEGANSGVLDAALLVDQLVKVKNGEISQAKAIASYEEEMKVRGRATVLKSRQACLDGHNWERINDDCPLIGSRQPPATA